MHTTFLLWFLAAVTIYFVKRVEPLATLSSVHTESKFCQKKNTPAEEVNLNYRLPNTSYPEHYDIKLTTNVHTGENYFRGEVAVDIVVVEVTDNIVIHARQLHISNTTLVHPSTLKTEELSHEYEVEREFLTLRRQNNKEFPVDTKWKLIILYKSELSNGGEGFNIFPYTDDAGNITYSAFTHLIPINARQVFPCYDEPDKPATFTLTINHSASYTAISNMPANEALSSAGKTVFLTTPRMPTYIVSYVVSELKYSELFSNGVIQRVYARPDIEQNHKYIVDVGITVEKYLEEYCGIGPIVSKIDHVVVPFSPLDGFQKWGLMLNFESRFFANEAQSSMFALRNMELKFGLEVTRQWFGVLLTIKWWNYLWLQDGFTTLFAHKAWDNINPAWNIWQNFHFYYQKSLNMDADKSARSLAAYMQKPKEIAESFDGVSNYKGACVLHMWNNALTEQVFQKGVHTFFMTNRNTPVGEQQLFTALQSAVEEENYKLSVTVSKMISTWTQQSGYPILTVTRNYDDGSFTIKQEAFHDHATPRETKTWYVPINYAVASNHDFHNTAASHYLLNVAEMKVHNANISKNDWLVLNKQSTGFYRINYDLENWNLIIENLIENPSVFDYRNRAQFIDDAFHFHKAHRLHYSILLKLLSYLKGENQYVPWYTVFTILEKYNRFVKYDDFKFFISDQVGPIYEKLGVDEISGEDYFDKLTRKLVISIACEFGLEKCLQDTSSKLKDVVNKNVTIEFSLKQILLKNGLRNSNDDVFDFFYQKFLHTKGLRSKLMEYLGHTQNKNQIEKYIYSTIDKSNTLRATNRYKLLQTVYVHGGISLLTCIEFLKANWNAYGNLEKPGSNPLNDDILKMASYVVDSEQRQKLMELVVEVKNSTYVKPSLEADIKKYMEKTVKWSDRHGQDIKSWMSQYRARAHSN